MKLSLGPYPAVSLKDARERKNEVKRLLAAGIDPGQQKKDAALIEAKANTFEAIADELLNQKRRETKADRTLGKVEWLLSLARLAHFAFTQSRANACWIMFAG